MESKVKILGHPIHPMLVAYPIAFYTAALVCYIVYNAKADVFWFKVAVVANIAGVVMAVVAALPGFIDWLFLPKGSGAKKTGFLHMSCNILALICFATLAFLECKKWNDTNPSVGTAIILAGLGLLFTFIAGYLGFNMIQKHHVGVDEVSKP
jgi:uncharacterized membrane protein